MVAFSGCCHFLADSIRMGYQTEGQKAMVGLAGLDWVTTLAEKQEDAARTDSDRLKGISMEPAGRQTCVLGGVI